VASRNETPSAYYLTNLAASAAAHLFLSGLIDIRSPADDKDLRQGQVFVVDTVTGNPEKLYSIEVKICTGFGNGFPVIRSLDTFTSTEGPIFPLMDALIKYPDTLGKTVLLMAQRLIVRSQRT
jgi:hypothetical protein